MLRKALNKFSDRVVQELKNQGETILGVSPGANFFGVESKGGKQVRGNGVLILTERELYFRMWKPERETRIPLKWINGRESTKKHIHKTMGRPLLKVNYTNMEGQPDSAAWMINHLAEWEVVIDSIIAKNG